MNIRTAVLLAAIVASGLAHAEVTVKEPWVRATIAQQKATGAFMTLTSSGDAKLISVSSPVAGVVEVHEMAMEGDVMRMRAVSDLSLPAGKAVDLKPGGYHVMLMGLKQPLKAGDTVPVTLVVEGKDQKRETIEVQAPVRALSGQMMQHKH
jgi:periplasmic copper chaperone A